MPNYHNLCKVNLKYSYYSANLSPHFKRLTCIVNSSFMRKELFSVASLLLTALLLSGGQLQAQCERVGWVASVTPGCRAKIIDLDDAQVYSAVYGADDLVGGQTISFKTAPAPMPQGCTVSNGLIVSLTCVSDTLPCSAHFGNYVDASDPLTFIFEANVYDETTQICHWEFGDGSVATGKNVAHGFPQQGEYAVCLKVMDAFGCAAEYCETVKVAAENNNGCAYDMRVTAVGTQLIGKVFPIDAQSDNILQSVVWYSSKSSNIIAQTPEFTAPLPGYGTYLVCAQYNVSNGDGTLTCASTQCEHLTVAEPSCVNPGLIDVSKVCPSQSALYAPVCGCNGITYGNECEAISAGISSWWAGDCAMQGNSCLAQMDVKILDGSLDDGYTARFINNSTGDYTYARLDFGDDSNIWESTQWDTVLHVYPAGGIYKTNLTTWKTGGCISSSVQLLVTDALNMNTSSLPGATDYVRPGDANRDGKANVYDLLHLGVGHYTLGSPRPEASTSWTPQFSPNWLESVANQVNYKHLDCDGNGTVNEYDADVIVQHYSAIDSFQMVAIPNAPQVRIEFPLDTFVIDANNPAPLELKGNVILGSPTMPALGVYGLAFAMEYPEYVGHNPDADYKSDYFGSPNHMLWLAKDNHAEHQLDIGLSRKNGQQASGYGKIAEVTFRADFIIIIDVTDRAENHVIPFAVPIRGIKAIDNQGNVKQISCPAQLDTVWIKLIGTTGTNDLLARSVAVAPNPASDFVTLYFGDLEVESIEAINVFGQVLSRIQPVAQRSMSFPVRDLPNGVYTLRIKSEKGVVLKHLVVGR